MASDIENRVGTLEAIAQGQQAQLNLLAAIMERVVEQTAAIERKADVAQRLWVHFAGKYGWLD